MRRGLAVTLALLALLLVALSVHIYPAPGPVELPAPRREPGRLELWRTGLAILFGSVRFGLGV